MAIVPAITRTLEQVTADLDEVRKTGDDGADVSMARLMYRHGNLTDDAREYALAYFTDRAPCEHLALS